MMVDKLRGVEALVVFSGGQDSTVCLAWAKQQFGKVGAITFHYGQRHRSEISAALEIARRLEVPHITVPLQFMAHVTPESALTNYSKDIEVPEEGLPTTFVPGRNILFLTIAAQIAYVLNITNIVTGVCQADYSGYPDCRLDTITKLEAALRAAMERKFVVRAPLMFSTKAQTWAEAERLGVLELVRDYTVTCYQGIPGKGCGECPACLLRERGRVEFFKEKGVCPECEGTGWVDGGRYHGHLSSVRCPKCNED